MNVRTEVIYPTSGPRTNQKGDDGGLAPRLCNDEASERDRKMPAVLSSSGSPPYGEGSAVAEDSAMYNPFFLSLLLILFLSLLSTRLTSLSVPPVVATTHPPEWTGDPEARTNRVLPSVRKGWTCKACGDRAVYATQAPRSGGY